MVDNDTSYAPGDSVDVDGGSPTSLGTAGNGNCYPGLLAEWSVATYGNGVVPMTANYGDSNTEEADCMSIEIAGYQLNTTTAFSVATAYTTGQSLTLVHHVRNKVYWLKASSLTCTKNKTKLVPAGSGLVKAALAHTATPLPMHMWKAKQTKSAATWVKGQYLGLVSSYSA